MSTKKYLQQYSKEQLINQILELCKKYKDVKTYYTFHQQPDSKKENLKYKKQIENAFFKGNMLNLKAAKAAVTGFKKLSPAPEALAEVMLFYVECGVAFTVDFGDVDGLFYTSMGNMFFHTCKLIQQYDMFTLFKQRCEKIVGDAQGIGWGFGDNLSDTYSDFFPYEDEQNTDNTDTTDKNG